MTAPVLRAAQIRVSFGGVVACDDIDLVLGRGEVVGLTGPNGSGKSTLLNALTGLVHATGRVEVEGEALRLGRPREVRRRGVVRTFQSPQNWFALSVLDNVALGCPDRSAMSLAATVFGRRAMARHERARWVDARAALARVGLGGLASAPAASLTYGQQRMLELARAIAARPSVLLLDEPSAGLNAAETGFLGGVLQQLRDEGVSMVVVDHKVDFLDALCDRIVVLELGRVVADAPPAEVWQHAAVIDAYLGSGGDEW